MRGTGTFRPLPGADPYDGEIGQMQQADEWRLEVIVPATQRDKVIAAMIEAHPDEEVAYDAYPLHNEGLAYGAARFGTLPRSTPILDYAHEISQNLRVPSTRIMQSKKEIQKIACVPGSGASYIEAAARANCDCLGLG